MGVFDRLRGGGRDRGARRRPSPGRPVPRCRATASLRGRAATCLRARDPGRATPARGRAPRGAARRLALAAAHPARHRPAGLRRRLRVRRPADDLAEPVLHRHALPRRAGRRARRLGARRARHSGAARLRPRTPLALLAGGDTGGDGRPHGRAVRAAREPPGRGDRADGPEGDRRTARGHPASGADRAHQGAGRARGTAAGAAGGDTVRATSYGERPLGVDGFACRGRGPFRLSLPARLLRGHALGGRSHRRSPAAGPMPTSTGPAVIAAGRGPAVPGPVDSAPGGSPADAGRSTPSASVPRSSYGVATTGPVLPVQRRTSGGTGRPVPGAPASDTSAAVSAAPKPRADVPTAGKPRRRSALGAPLSSPASNAAPPVRLDSPAAGPESGLSAPVRGPETPAGQPGAPGGVTPVRHRVRRGGFRFRALGCRRSGTTRRVLRCPGPGLVPHPACGQRPAACSRGERLRAVLRPGGAVASARTCAHPRTRVDLGPARRAPGHRGAAPHRPRGRTAASHHGRRRACGWRRFRGRAVRPAPRTPRGAPRRGRETASPGPRRCPVVP